MRPLVHDSHCLFLFLFFGDSLFPIEMVDETFWYDLNVQFSTIDGYITWIVISEAIFPWLPLFMYDYTECLNTMSSLNIISQILFLFHDIQHVFVFLSGESNQETSVMHSHKTNLKCSCIAKHEKAKLQRGKLRHQLMWVWRILWALRSIWVEEKQFTSERYPKQKPEKKCCNNKHIHSHSRMDLVELFIKIIYNLVCAHFWCLIDFDLICKICAMFTHCKCSL